uniref:Conserved hypothetical plastid protein n=1 Tax=Flintiella sanguinaria TaxID=101926 RepID=A0A1X9PUD2_9RHOD|nr:conserved hypothetical plastid protein [Flintiella sanguinaria]
MLFWKNFFSRCNLIGDKPFSSRINFDQLLLKQVEYSDNKLNIYATSEPIFNLYELEQLCDSVGWVKRPQKRIKIALQNSFLTLTLFYFDSNHKQIIGFARVTSDHTFHATIWDVVVDPKFQGNGLGKLLLYYLIKQLRIADISTVTLFADSQVVNFYKKLGFIADPNNIKGMFWYPK